MQTPHLDILAPLQRCWKRLLLSSLLGAAIGLAGSALVTPRYESTTSFRTPPAPRPSLPEDAHAIGRDIYAIAGLTGRADQVAGLLRSRLVADRLVDRFALPRVYDLPNRDEVRARLALHTDVESSRDDGLIRITVSDADPARAAALANAYVMELKAVLDRLPLSEARIRATFFEGLVAQAGVRLNAARQAVASVGIDAGMRAVEPAQAAADYSRALAVLDAARLRLDVLQGSHTDADAEVGAQRSEVEALEEQLARLASPGPRARSHKEYVSLYRELQYDQVLYDLLARQYDSARIDAERDGRPILVVDPARPAEQVTYPRRGRLAIGAFLAVLFGHGAWLLSRRHLGGASR